jgi:hypothetical protein
MMISGLGKTVPAAVILLVQMQRHPCVWVAVGIEMRAVRIQHVGNSRKQAAPTGSSLELLSILREGLQQDEGSGMCRKQKKCTA